MRDLDQGRLGLELDTNRAVFKFHHYSAFLGVKLQLFGICANFCPRNYEIVVSRGDFADKVSGSAAVIFSNWGLL